MKRGYKISQNFSRSKLILFFIGFVLAVSSCSKRDSSDFVEPSFALQEMDNINIFSRLEFLGDLGTQQYKVRTNGHWDVMVSDDWITVDPMSGNGDGEVSIGVGFNPNQKRIGWIKFITDTVRVDTIGISQSGLNLLLDIDPVAPAEFSARGEEFTFGVQTNGNEWDIEILDSEIITERERSDTSLTITILPNSMENKRSTMVVFSLRDFPLFKPDTVVISQLGKIIVNPDLLDIVFNSDMTAADSSPLALPVEYITKTKPVTISYNDIIGRNIVHFDPPAPGSWLNYQGSWYDIRYKENPEFNEKFEDGFTMICLVKFDNNFQTNPMASDQAFFGSYYGGGAGFRVEKEENNLIFQARISKTDYVNYSGIIPDNNTWYHLAGVWDKANEKMVLYINGELVSELNEVVGDLTPPNEAGGAGWICIGGGIAYNTIGSAFQGYLGITEIFDQPLTKGEIGELWKEYERLND